MPTATFVPRMKQLELCSSRNTTVYVHCASVGDARKIIARSGIEQTLVILRR
jgi:hypothetical protein